MLAQTSNGETVNIVDKIGRPGGDILVSEDGRQFVQAKHGINIIPLTEADAAAAEENTEEPENATEPVEESAVAETETADPVEEEATEAAEEDESL